MSVEIDLGEPLARCALVAARTDENAAVQLQKFISTAIEQHVIRLLEGEKNTAAASFSPFRLAKLACCRLKMHGMLRIDVLE